MGYLEIFRKRSSSFQNNNTGLTDNYSIQAARGLTNMLSSSPNAIFGTIDGIEYKIILESKSYNKNKDIKKVLAPYSVPLKVGTIFSAISEDWIVIEQKKNVVDVYFTGTAVQSNYSLKWKNKYGVIEESQAFITGSMYGFVRNNFETSPIQIETTTKEIMAIMPACSLNKDDRIMFNDKAWKIVLIDAESVSGLYFMSLESDDINREYDNVELNIADQNKPMAWTIEVQNDNTIEILRNETIEIVPIVKLNGNPTDEICEIAYFESAFLTFEDLSVFGVDVGSTDVSVTMVNNPEITLDITVDTVPAKSDERVVYIDGPEKIDPFSINLITGYESIDGESQIIAGGFGIALDVDGIIEDLSSIDSTSANVTILGTATIGQSATIRFSSGGQTAYLIMTVKSYWT